MLDLSSSFQLTTAFRQLLPLRVGLLHGFQKVTTWNDGSPGPWKWVGFAITKMDHRYIYICRIYLYLYHSIHLYIYIYHMSIYIYIMGVRQNAGMDRPTVIRTYGSVCITCVLVWIGGMDRPVASGNGSGCTFSLAAIYFIHNIININKY